MQLSRPSGILIRYRCRPMSLHAFTAYELCHIEFVGTRCRLNDLGKMKMPNFATNAGALDGVASNSESSAFAATCITTTSDVSLGWVSMATTLSETCFLCLCFLGRHRQPIRSPTAIASRHSSVMDSENATDNSLVSAGSTSPLRDTPAK